MRSGAEVVFDGYNANPESMSKLIENSLKVKHAGKKIGVIGEMGEMGVSREKVHHELGAIVGAAGFDLIWFIGISSEQFGEGLKEANYAGSSFFSLNYDPAVALRIKLGIGATDKVWIKGSRSMKLEQVVRAFDPLDFKDKD